VLQTWQPLPAAGSESWTRPRRDVSSTFESLGVGKSPVSLSTVFTSQRYIMVFAALLVRASMLIDEAIGGCRLSRLDLVVQTSSVLIYN